jgi:hypothetical protein
MGSIETGVDIAQNRMSWKSDAMAVHTPLLPRQWLPVNLVKMLEQGVCGQARA